LCALGARTLVLTNAAGTLHADWRPGDAMLIRDHLNLLGGSPLEGCLDEDFGSRFADLGNAWPGSLRVGALKAAPRGLTVREGVYAACRGPQYETPAEVRMLRILGADAVGMSTVPEAIVAAQMRVPTLGISLVTNHAAGVSQKALTHAEVLAVGKRSAKILAEWLEKLVPTLAALSARRNRRK
jgi:purine-nucleoside phosphorylase